MHCIGCLAHDAPFTHGLVPAATPLLSTAPRPRSEPKHETRTPSSMRPNQPWSRSHWKLTDRPLLASVQAKTVAVVVVTGDRGLCGGYNAGMIKKAEARILELVGQVPSPTPILVGGAAAGGREGSLTGCGVRLGVYGERASGPWQRGVRNVPRSTRFSSRGCHAATARSLVGLVAATQTQTQTQTQHTNELQRVL